MNIQELTIEITRRLHAHETPSDVAAALSLDYAEGAVVLPGWVADDGNQDVEYPDATSDDEAAQEYVSDGDWGDDEPFTQWINVHTWRVGLRLDDVDLVVVEVRVCEGSHRVAIEPAAPECCADEHKWSDDHGLVGGCESNPGVFGHGGGVICKYICVYCGISREDDSWAQDPEDGTQGLDSVTYTDIIVDADDLARHWLGRYKELQAAVDEDGLDLTEGPWPAILAEDRENAECEDAIEYVRCCYGADGSEPGDNHVEICEGRLRWWLRDSDDSESEDVGEDEGYDTQDAATEAAQDIADEHGDGEEGEDAEAMVARLQAEALARASADGEWVVAWRDGSSPRAEPLSAGRRYVDRSDAETEIDAWYAAVREHTPRAMTGAMVHPVLAQLDDGELVEVKEERDFFDNEGEDVG
jgi:hypothetical protein